MLRAVISNAFNDKVQYGFANDIYDHGAKLCKKESYSCDKIRARRQEVLLETLKFVVNNRVIVLPEDWG